MLSPWLILDEKGACQPWLIQWCFICSLESGLVCMLIMANREKQWTITTAITSPFLPAFRVFLKHLNDVSFGSCCKHSNRDRGKRGENREREGGRGWVGGIWLCRHLHGTPYGEHISTVEHSFCVALEITSLGIAQLGAVCISFCAPLSSSAVMDSAFSLLPCLLCLKSQLLTCL